MSDFLEEKRAKFPRFYFIGDDDMLEILGQSSNPSVIQTHLKKLFAGIHSVHFAEGNKKIISMCSSDGEVVNLVKHVTITDEVEVWLRELADEMKFTLKKLLLECCSKFDNKFPSQVVGLAEMIKFTNQCEEAIKKGVLGDFHDEVTKRLRFLTSMDCGYGVALYYSMILEEIDY